MLRGRHPLILLSPSQARTTWQVCIHFKVKNILSVLQRWLRESFYRTIIIRGNNIIIVLVYTHLVC